MATDAQLKAIKKYKKKAYKRIPLELKQDEFEELEKYLIQTGESRNGFIRRIIKESIHNSNMK